MWSREEKEKGKGGKRRIMQGENGMELNGMRRQRRNNEKKEIQEIK